MTAKRDVKMVAWILTLLLIAMATKAALNWLQLPVSSVDYLEQFSDLRRPADYDVDKCGAEELLLTAKVMNKRIGQGLNPHLWNGGANSLWAGNCPLNDPNGERWFALMMWSWPADANDADRSRFKAWLEQNEQLFAMFEHAMAKEYHWFQWRPEDGIQLMPDQRALYDVPSLGSAILWRARARVCSGDTIGGLRDTEQVCDMAGLFANHPMGFEWFVGQSLLLDGCGNSLLIASRASLSADQLAELSASIERNSPAYRSFDVLVEWPDCEVQDLAQRFFSDDGEGDGRFLASAWYRHEMAYSMRYRQWVVTDLRHNLGVLLESLGYAWTTESRKATLARWERALSRARVMAARAEMPESKPFDEFWAFGEDFGNNILLINRGRYLAQLVRHVERTRMTIDGTLGVLAILRFQTEKATLPDGWEELVKAGYLKETPMDCFAAAPLAYRRTSAGFTVYSVGEPKVEYSRSHGGPITFWPVEKVEPSFKMRIHDPNAQY